jgi:hypothetical protein
MTLRGGATFLLSQIGRSFHVGWPHYRHQPQRQDLDERTSRLNQRDIGVSRKPRRARSARSPTLFAPVELVSYLVSHRTSNPCCQPGGETDRSAVGGASGVEGRELVASSSSNMPSGTRR